MDAQPGCLQRTALHVHRPCQSMTRSPRHLRTASRTACDVRPGTVQAVIAEGKWRTGDLGGKAKRSEFTNAIIDKLV